MYSLAKRKSMHEKQYAIRKFAKLSSGKRGLKPRAVNVSIPRGPTGKTFPVTMTTDMIWAKADSQNLSVAGNYTLLIRANSVYDPEYSTGAGQLSCNGLGTMTQLYGKYHVTAVTFEIQATMTGA